MGKKYSIDLGYFLDKRKTALIRSYDGETLLETLKKDNVVLKDLEKTNDVIEIIIPKNIVTINYSYFAGFLETRVIELGKKYFMEKYSFNTSEHIRHKIERHVYKILQIDAAVVDGLLQTDVGIDRYLWQTSFDERKRHFKFF